MNIRADGLHTGVSAANATPWEMLRNEFESFLSGQGGGESLAGLQMVTTPMDAVWDNATYGTWLAWETWANNIPVWGPTYQPSAGNRVTDAYIQVLNNIDVPDVADPEAKKKADLLRQEMDKLNDEIGTLQDQLGAAWMKFDAGQKGLPPNRRTTFDTWYAQHYGAKIAGLTTQMNGLMGDFASASNKAGGGYQSVGQAILNFNNPAFQMPETDQSGAQLSYRTWSLQPELKDWIAEAKQGKVSTLSLTINTHTKTQSTTQWGASAKAGFLYGIFSFGGSGSGTHLNVDTSETDFSMTWAAKGFTAVRIAAGQWYSQQVLQTFKNGPWLKDGPFGSGAAQPYGDKGTFALQPVVIYIAYQPSVTATVDQKTYSEVKTTWQAGLEIGIGPFTFGGTTEGSKDDARWDDAKRSFTITSASEHPQVIAVLNNLMPGN
jgi:hypothetical protein